MRPPIVVNPRLHWTAALLFLLTFGLRFLSFRGFGNDHFVYLAPAQQLLYGEWPSRDFVDPGAPLMYVVSAAARLIIESPQLAELILVSLFFALAATLTLYACLLASGSLLVSVAAAVIQVAMFPRTYHYPKLLLPALVILALWRYAQRPTGRREALVAFAIVLSGLFRHDLAVFALTGALTTAALSTDTVRGAVMRAARLLVVTALLLVPYAAYVQMTTGIVPHLLGGLDYSRNEQNRTGIGLPSLMLETLTVDESLPVALFYALHVLALVTLLAALKRLRAADKTGRQDFAWIAGTAAMAVISNLALLRDPLLDRVPDVSVPACVLASWLMPRMWKSGPALFLRRGFIIATAVVVLAAVNVVGAPAEILNRAGLPAWPGPILEHVRERMAEITAPFDPQLFPSDTLEALVPILEYVRRCTAEDDYLFVVGNVPEAYVYAQRRFAAGLPFLRRRFFDSLLEQRRAVFRLWRQRTPVVFVLSSDKITNYPLLTAEFDGFDTATEVDVGNGERWSIRIDPRIRPVGIDTPTGLPCFR